MDYVKVHGHDMSIKLPVKNGILKLSCLKKYFTQATGLTFMKNNEKCGLEIENDDIVLINEVREYDVYSSKGTIFNIQHDRRVNDIMKALNEDSDLESPMILDVPAEKKVKKKDTRSISVGWKHRDTPTKKYEQMKGVMGGVKELILDREIEYYYEDLLQLCASVMKNEENTKFLENSCLELGNFKDQIFEEFKKENVNFWEVAHIMKGKNSVIRIYILSTKIHEDSKRKPLTEKSDTQNKNQIDSWNMSVLNINARSLSSSKRSPSDNKGNFSSAARPISYELTAGNGMEVKDPLENEQYLKSLNISVPIVDIEDISLYHTQLGAGSYGTVLKGEWLGTEVAVKRIKLEGKKKYVYREILLMDKIRHPNIISIMSVAINNFDCYIVMEMFHGENLRTAIFEQKVYDDYHMKDKKQYIATQICTAVAFLHALSPCITHKDIKPENILINKDGFIKLCDFGVSSLSEMPAALCSTYGNNFKGTPMYMAPEILLRNEHATPKSDVWSLACVVVELYTERTVWTFQCNDPYHVAIEKLKAVITHEKPNLQNVPDHLKMLLRASFDHQPKKRPCASTFLDVLKFDMNGSV